MNKVLLQRILSEKLPWAQWILLAALEILADREVPMLDKESLEILQGMLNRASFTHDISADEEHQNTLVSEEDTGNGPLNGVNILGKDEQNSGSFVGLSNGVKMKDFEVQVNPKIMKTTASKWIQVRICKTSNKGIQSSVHCSDSAMQTSEFSPKIHATDKKLRNADTQTILVYYKDAEVQWTPYGTEKDIVWKLIPITDIQEKRSSRTSASSVDEGFTDSENRQEPLLCDSFSPKGSVFTGKPNPNLKLFHGRPLIGKNSNKQAADIPQNPVHNDPVIMLQDPRGEARRL